MGCSIEDNKAQIITGFFCSQCAFDSDVIALLETSSTAFQIVLDDSAFI